MEIKIKQERRVDNGVGGVAIFKRMIRQSLCDKVTFEWRLEKKKEKEGSMKVSRGESPRQGKQQMQRSWGCVSAVFKMQQGSWCAWSRRTYGTADEVRVQDWCADCRGPFVPQLLVSVEWEAAKRAWAEKGHDQDETRCVERTFLIPSLQLLLLLLVPTRTAANFLRLFK